MIWWEGSSRFRVSSSGFDYEKEPELETRNSKLEWSSKESSDELNPAVIAADAVWSPARPARSAKDYLALTIALRGWLSSACARHVGSLVGVGFICFCGP